LAATVLAPVEADAWTIKVTGTIFDMSDGSPGSIDGFGLFGAANASLVGDAYTETITTDPFLNSSIQCATATCLGTIGATAPGSSAAPYMLTVTVNGISFVHNESAASLNSAMLVDALSTNDPTDPAPYDLVSQSLGSGDCGAGSGGVCTFTALQALSATTPFVPTLDFNQEITVAGGFNYAATGSYSAFGMFGGPSDVETSFYGSVDTLSVNRVSAPEPGTLLLLGAGLASIGLSRRRRKS
jgi:hypothetical protein